MNFFPVGTYRIPNIEFESRRRFIIWEYPLNIPILENLKSGRREEGRVNGYERHHLEKECDSKPVNQNLMFTSFQKSMRGRKSCEEEG